MKQAESILLKNKNNLEIFEEAVNKNNYQCINAEDVGCSFANIRHMSNIAALKSLMLYNSGRVEDSQQYAQKIIKLGEMMAGSSRDLLAVLFSEPIYKTGYKVLNLVKATTVLSENEKNRLISKLKESYRDAALKEYSDIVELVEYIDDPNKVINLTENYISVEQINFFRQVVEEYGNWDAFAAKKLFYDSLVVDLANLDAPCGTPYVNSYTDVGIDLDTVDVLKNYATVNMTNFIYASGYLPYNSIIERRCEVEDLINTL
jgi:hypothetical protein